MLPTMTEQERQRAQAASVQARQATASLKHRLREREVSPRYVLANAEAGDATAAKMKVLALVRTQRGYGPTKATALLDRLGIAHSRRLRGLGPRQRSALAEALA